MSERLKRPALRTAMFSLTLVLSAGMLGDTCPSSSTEPRCTGTLEISNTQYAGGRCPTEASNRGCSSHQAVRNDIGGWDCKLIECTDCRGLE